MRRRSGFTLVELLIVIVVIAIMAAISVVAYNGVQERARDSQRKSDLAAIAKAYHMWNIDNPDQPFMTNGSGCGGNSGDGHAWFNLSNSSTYPKRMSDCLVEEGYLDKELIDPTGTRACSSGAPESCFAYMKCTSAAGTYLFAHLESLPAATTEANGSCASSWDTGYGMNYVIKIG